ncbi:MAG: glycosyltransferase [Bdellovibrionaceae bacterium]|nr:glycosyltransferase [Pseudobdellovibrionaceae bacterium]
MAPVVSIVLLAHRPDSYFLAALRSIEIQEFRDFETIVVANGPDRAQIESLAKSREKLNAVVILAPSGEIASLANLGISAAQGKFICRFDSDDLCCQDRLQRQVEFMVAHPQIGVVGGQAEVIDGNGSIVGSLHRPLDGTSIRRQMPFRCPMLQPSVMIRREALVLSGGYRLGSHAEDWDLWIRLLHAGVGFANLAQPMIQYRIHGSQTTRHRWKQLTGELRVLWHAFAAGYGWRYLFGFLFRFGFAVVPHPGIQWFRRQFGKWQSLMIRRGAP